MAQALWQIQNSAAAGHHMVATQDIAKGTMILEDAPLVVIDTQIVHTNWENGVAFFANKRDNTTNHIQATFGR